MGSSFTDEEKRFLLAEIIKTSRMDVGTLSNFIRANGIEPNWLQMQLPFGRNMNQCMQAADQVGIKQVPWLKRKMTDDQGGPSSKRMSSQGNVEPSAVAAAPHHVPILPRPASSSAEITPAPTPAPPPAPPATGPKKKGRPSRADRAKLRPILPQSIAPRPPVEQNQGTQLASQSSNQSNDQLVHQPVHQPVHQSSNQIATQSNNQLANQSSNQPAIQSNNQLAKQPVNQFAKQSSNQLANQFQTNQTTQGPAVPRTISPQSLDAARLLDMNNYSTSYTGTPGGGTKLEGASPQDEASRPRVMAEPMQEQFGSPRPHMLPGPVPLEPEPRASSHAAGGLHNELTTLAPLLERDANPGLMGSPSLLEQHSPVANSA